MTDPQWKEQLENQVPYVPNPENYKRRKKLPMPRTRYLLDKIFKKK